MCRSGGSIIHEDEDSTAIGSSTGGLVANRSPRGRVLYIDG